MAKRMRGRAEQQFMPARRGSASDTKARSARNGDDDGATTRGQQGQSQSSEQMAA